jgi:hypothetical protein
VESACQTGMPAANDATCDGIDSDCDGTNDEDYVPLPTSCGVGACAATGNMACIAGSVVDDCQPGSPIAEVCDNADNDCDGQTDEDPYICSDCNPETDDCCEADGTACEHGCDGTECYPECNPSIDPCCADDGTIIPNSWKDSTSGLCWQDPPSASTMNWYVAAGIYHSSDNPTTSNYCSALGGRWRLPTISELRSLFQSGDATACEPIEWDMRWTSAEPGYCGVWDDCLSFSGCYESSTCYPSGCGTLEGPGTGGCYWDAALSGPCDWYWASSEVQDFPFPLAWFVDFAGENVFVDGYEQNVPLDVRCVRSEPVCNPETDDCCEADGTWTKNEVQLPGTNLYWLRCPLGQSWDLSTCACTGDSILMTKCESLGEPIGTTECPTPPGPDICDTLGYRLPTRWEFMDLLGHCDTDLKGRGLFGYCDPCVESATCSDMFEPSTWPGFWSSSPIFETASYAAYFDTGLITTRGGSTTNLVRCMRFEGDCHTACEHGCDGNSCYPQCNPSDPCCEPDGTTKSWYDATSGLCWQKFPSETAMNWYRAAGVFHYLYNPNTKNHCSTLGSEWRLPTISELRSLVRSGNDAECHTIEWDINWDAVPPGYCGVWDDCRVANNCWTSACDPTECGNEYGPGAYGCYWDIDMAFVGGLAECGYYWSSSVQNGDCPPRNFPPTYCAWFTDFETGGVYQGYAEFDGSVICVR